SLAALVALQAAVGQQYFNLMLRLDGGGGFAGGISQALYPATTYLIVGRITWSTQQGFAVEAEAWVNPPAAYPGNGSLSAGIFTFPGPLVFSSIGFGISSTDTGGPTSTAIFDELRIGYTWADVVLPGPAAANFGNISTRLRVETGGNALIGGFIVTGTQPKRVIVRAIGPSLPLAGKLDDPTLELYGPSGLLQTNDSWVESPNKQAILDSGVAPTNDKESAIVATLPAN